MAVPFLWRFHALHHSDPDVDVTTSVRHHPIEHVLASGVYWVAVIVLDIAAVVALTHGRAVFRYGQHPAWEYSPSQLVGALAAAGAGHGRHAPRPSLDRVQPDELELWGRPIGMGSVLRNLYEPQPRAA